MTKSHTADRASISSSRQRHGGWRPSDDDLDLLLVWVNELMRRRRAARVPVDAQMIAVARRLDLQVLSRRMSGSGHESDRHGSTLADDLIGTREAAMILGRSKRHVRRIAADLDGEKVDGKTLFRRSAVIDYQQAKESI